MLPSISSSGIDLKASLRFAFNGQEKTDEISGVGNHNTALYWEYDTRLGRRWNVDPVVKSWVSGYAAFGNNPIRFVDTNGDDWVESKDGGVRRNENVTAKNYQDKGILGEDEISRGTSYERNRIWSNINVSGNVENGLMKETYKVDGKMEYANLTPWVDKAFEEMGVARFEGQASNSRIEKYLTYTQLKGADINDATSWCAGFANFTLETSDVQGTGSAMAMSFRGSWGQNLENPAYGSIATVSYGRGKGHVGIVIGTNINGQILILGGNQGASVPGGQNEVNISPNSTSKFKYHYPKGSTPTYNLPILNLTGKSINYGNTR